MGFGFQTLLELFATWESGSEINRLIKDLTYMHEMWEVSEYLSCNKCTGRF